MQREGEPVYPLGENTSFEQGAMTEPVACCLHGMDLCGIRPGHQVVVIGGGMIGLIMVQLAKLAGAAKVALLEPVKGKRETAEKLGADLCTDPTEQGIPIKKLLREAGFLDSDRDRMRGKAGNHRTGG